MRPLRRFEEFLKEGVVKRQRVDASRARSLADGAEKRRIFLKEMEEKIGVSDENANYFAEAAYDILIELIRAKMLLEGLKAAGLNAHEAEVSYLRELDFSEPEVRFMNELRYFRNRIKYYGKRLDAEHAERVLKFLREIYSRLRKKYLEKNR